MRTLKQVHHQHPEREKITERFKELLNVSQSTFYRIRNDGSIIGRRDVIPLLFNEFGIKIFPNGLFEIDYLKLKEIEDKQKEKTANTYGLTA